MNYFELFEIPITIKIDNSFLTKKYIELQKKYHPDNFTLATEQEQFNALEKSAQINKAIKVLKNEDEIIRYILQLKSLLQEEEKYDLPQDFLMDVMELNELLVEDGIIPAERIEAIKNSIYNEVADIITNYNDKEITENQLLKLKDYYFKKKYLYRILDKING